MIKMLSYRFERWFGTFTMLLLEGSSETRLFRHLYDHVFWSRNFGNTKYTSVIFFLKYLKFNLDFENALKNWEKVFCFRDNCIWIGIIKLSLLRRGYFSLVRNDLTSCPKISMWIRETFSNSIDLSVINEYDKGAVMQIWTVLGHVYHLLVEGWYEMGSFKTFIWPRFRSPYFRKYKIYPGQLFFRNIWNLLRISKIQQKIEKRFLFLR